MAFMHPVAEYFNETDLIEFGICEDGEPEAGWYGRLSAPGYLDATDWLGPFKTEDEALREVMEFYEVDEDGNSLDEDMPNP